MYRFVLCLTLLSGSVSAAYAASSVQIYTGPKTGTYYAVGRDIQNTITDSTLDIQLKTSEGSVDNIKAIHKNKGLTLGIIQSDVLGFLARSENQDLKEILANLRVVFPLYSEEIHVLARKDIASFRDLQGKKVAVGEDGSGHILTAYNLLAIEQIVPSDIQKISPEKGVVAVLRGELDAIIFIGGKPVKLFKNMEDLTNPENRKFALLLQQVHFLPMDSPKFYEEYEPAKITRDDYMFVQNDVPTISVRAALVAIEDQSLPHYKSNCKTLGTLTQLLASQLPSLQKNGHPKWKDVDFSDTVHGIEQSSCIAKVK